MKVGREGLGDVTRKGQLFQKWSNLYNFNEKDRFFLVCFNLFIFVLFYFFLCTTEYENDLRSHLFVATDSGSA